MRGARLALALTLAAVALVAAACGEDAAPPGAGERVDLVLDWFPNTDHAGVYGAIGEEYLAEEGLDVRPSVPSDPAAALKEVGAGRAPFAISYTPAVLLARAEGIPVIAVGALVPRPLNSVIVRRDRGIARPRELEGRTVGAPGLPMDRPLLDTVVGRDGGDPAAVRVRNVGFNLGPALAGGQVDALVGAYWNIEVVELEEKGVEVDVFRVDEFGVPAYDELVVVTSDRVARERPELVRALLRGLRRGQDWAAADHAGAAAHLLEANPDLDGEIVRRQLRLTADLLSPPETPTLFVDPRRWERFAQWMRDTGQLDRPVEVSAAVTDRFLPREDE